MPWNDEVSLEELGIRRNLFYRVANHNMATGEHASRYKICHPFLKNFLRRLLLYRADVDERRIITRCPTQLVHHGQQVRFSSKRRVRAVENSLDKRRRTRQAHRAAARRDQSEAGVDTRRCFATFQGNSSSMRLAW